MRRLAKVWIWVGAVAACDGREEGRPDERVLVCPEGAVEMSFDRVGDDAAPEDLQGAAEVRWCERDGLAEGPYREIGVDGQTLAAGAFVADRADGVWAWYHPRTDVRRKVVAFRGGVAHGDAAAWDADGSPRWERQYENGGACGTWKTWSTSVEEPVVQLFGSCDDGVAWEPRAVRDAPTDVERAWSGACNRDGARLVIGADVGRDEDAVWCEVDAVREGPFARFWDAERTRQREDGSFMHGVASGVWYSFASTGEVVGKSLLSGGVRDGAETLWRIDGSKEAARVWVAGQADGVWETFYPSGPKASETAWKAGLKDGREIALALDGTARRETSWRAGVRHGVERIHDESGAVDSETPYVDGLREGTATSWHPNGEKAEEIVFVDDRASTWKTWDVDGLPESESVFGANGLLHGPATIWLRDPVLGLRVKDEGDYVDGRAEGKWLGVYEGTGAKWRERTVFRGLSEGPFTMWWPDGSKQAEGELAWGYLEYVYRVWWDNENLALECGYHTGLRDGPCTEWWENGQMKARGEYVEGTKKDGWEYWDQAGNPTEAPGEDGP